MPTRLDSTWLDSQLAYFLPFTSQRWPCCENRASDDSTWTRGELAEAIWLHLCQVPHRTGRGMANVMISEVMTDWCDDDWCDDSNIPVLIYHKSNSNRVYMYEKYSTSRSLTNRLYIWLSTTQSDSCTHYSSQFAIYYRKCTGVRKICLTPSGELVGVWEGPLNKACASG